MAQPEPLRNILRQVVDETSSYVLYVISGRQHDITLHFNNNFIFIDESNKEWKVLFFFLFLGIWRSKVCGWRDLELHSTTRTVRRGCWRFFRFYFLQVSRKDCWTVWSFRLMKEWLLQNEKFEEYDKNWNMNKIGIKIRRKVRRKV